MNKENLDYIKYKFHDKDSEFNSWDYEILRDNDKSLILRLDIKLLQKDIEQLITELYERHLYISLLLIGSDEIANEYLIIGITEAELDKQYSNYVYILKSIILLLQIRKIINTITIYFIKSAKIIRVKMVK